MNKRFQVFVSSTFADLQDERSKVIQTIMELDCIPAGMEIFPAIDEEQFEFIKKVIDDCDYYILIIGGRYGTLSDDGISYTEKEYDYAIEKGIKVMAFLHKNPETIPIGKSELDEILRAKLQNFKQKVSSNRLIKYWETAEQLPGLVALSLSKTIKVHPAIGWIRANSAIDPDIFKEMNDLRKENQEIQNLLHQKKITEILEREDLADLDDEIEISGTHRRWNSKYKHEVNTTWNFRLTWGKIFSLISPYLLEHPSDLKAKEIISTQLYNETKDHISSGTPKVNDQDFQTIKIHLKSIGLIDVAYKKTTTGGMALFWELTELGNKYLHHKRSVKKDKLVL